ncbi:hypothetical protein IP79_02945 [Porphyrobacter sp. AAP60]|nr:hypothetical protein IP79_02945 [Porphyrobacter sp. AAP60]
METHATAKGPVRYRAYFWLMNASFVASIGLLLHFAIYFAAGTPGWGLPEGVASMLYWGFVYPLTTLIPLILLLAWFLRDDYAAALWKRTTVVLAYGVAIAPVLLVAASWLAYDVLTKGTPAYEAWDAFYLALIEGGSGRDILTFTWHVYMLLFVLIFQFLRWRDSR